tara:strand:- start:328 stop:1317 length:990 start_codon:yes stop_codon:yes gene_type:complete
MKQYIFVALFVLHSLNVLAFSDNISQTRQRVSSKLNSVVKDLKSDFQTSQNSLNQTIKETNSLQEDVKSLLDRAGYKESNPTILPHARAEIKSCNYDSENLHWNGTEWVCLPVSLATDCTPASDEYRYSVGDGIYKCTKQTKGGSLSYYWKFLGNSKTCTSGYYNKVYGCFYKNKLNQEIQVANSSCNGKSKPSATAKRCQAKPIYYCRAGLSLSGTRCVGTETINCDYYYPNTNHRKYVWDTGGGLIYVYVYHGQNRYYCINPYHRDCTFENGTMKGKTKFVKGKRVGRGFSGKGSVYQMCEQYSRNETAQVRCPSGLSYNSSTGMCQ